MVFMKKGILAIPALLVGLSLPMNIEAVQAADTLPTIIQDGKVSKGRTLLPIRAVNEALGSKVVWNQKNKTVTVNDGTNETVFTLGSEVMTVNGEPAAMDVPVQMKLGKTYIPLRAVAPTGSKIEWNNKTKQAAITYNDRMIVINTAPKVFDKNTEISSARYAIMLEKIDEIEYLSQLNQIRTWFEGHFTDRFINKIIHQNGIGEHNHKFMGANKTRPVYSPETGNLIITQEIKDHAGIASLKRTITLAKEDGSWKVYDITFEESVSVAE